MPQQLAQTPQGHPGSYLRRRHRLVPGVGKPARELQPGDAVVIPAGVKHWHGAAKDSWFAHLAVEVPGEETSNEWLEPVDDEQYGKLD